MPSDDLIAELARLMAGDNVLELHDTFRSLGEVAHDAGIFAHLDRLKRKLDRAADGAFEGTDMAKTSYLYNPRNCPSQHWNGGEDVCEDCGLDLQDEDGSRIIYAEYAEVVPAPTMIENFVVADSPHGFNWLIVVGEDRDVEGMDAAYAAEINAALAIKRAPKVFIVNGEHWAVPGNPMRAFLNEDSAKLFAAELVNDMREELKLGRDATADNWEERLLALRQVRAEESGIDYADEFIAAEPTMDGKLDSFYHSYGDDEDDDCRVWIETLDIHA